ncbi:MAG: hypothetical protein ACI9QL_005307 [Candidatus Omnitrophota bacterium]|jgi:hypothetical protein
MKRYKTYRLIGPIVIGLLLLVTLFLHFYKKHALENASFYTGWVLLAVMGMLASYNLRKKLPVAPLGTSRGWLHFHVWMGMATGIIFLFHIGFRWPNGPFELLLASLYLGVFLSGFFGWIISRLYARRLTTHGREVIYEQIPMLLHGVRTKAEAIAVELVPKTESTALADFYSQRLHGYFSRPQNFWMHQVESRRPGRLLLDDLNEQKRYMSSDEKVVVEEMADLVRLKDDLDYQYALQSVLKRWLFVHIPLTYSLLIFTVAHVIIVHAFNGSVS